MKRIFRGVLALGLLATGYATAASSCDTCPTDCDSSNVFGKTFFRARPADQNSAKEMMGVADKMHLWDKECEFYGVFSIALGYEQSSNSCGLGKYFAFGSDGTVKLGADAARDTTLNGGFATVSADSSTNARAIDFGLSPSFKSEITFSPRIEKGLVNLDLFLGLDEFINGLWFRAYAPVVWARYKIRPCEEISSKGGDLYAPGFVENSADTVAVPYKSGVNAWQNLGKFGDVEASGCGKIKCKSDTTTRLGAVHLDLGYDIIRCECGHFGIGLHGVIGTGNSPKACFLFPAVAGSYNNQLGAVIDGSWRIWSCDEEQFVTLYTNAVISHLFSDRQTRLFGLNVGGTTAGNSYLLLNTFDDNGIYQDKIVRAANGLGRSLKVRNDYLVDWSLMLQWRRCWLDLSIGYNFFYISKDKSGPCKGQDSASCKGACYFSFDDGLYGIKGVDSVGDGTGSDEADKNNTFYDKNDSNIAKSGTQVTLGSSANVTANADAFVKESDVTDCVALAPGAWSNKIFGYIGYNWECCDYQPFIGIGGSYEWAEKNKMADQWGVYLKGGLQF